jgi:hypothetical protein
VWVCGWFDCGCGLVGYVGRGGFGLWFLLDSVRFWVALWVLGFGVCFLWVWGCRNNMENGVFLHAECAEKPVSKHVGSAVDQHAVC